MALRFSVLGLLIVVNQHDGGASIPGGILELARCGNLDSSMPCIRSVAIKFTADFQLEEGPADEISSGANC
jgi:hypothetical protein